MLPEEEASFADRLHVALHLTLLRVARVRTLTFGLESLMRGVRPVVPVWLTWLWPLERGRAKESPGMPLHETRLPGLYLR